MHQLRGGVASWRTRAAASHEAAADARGDQEAVPEAGDVDPARLARANETKS